VVVPKKINRNLLKNVSRYRLALYSDTSIFLLVKHAYEKTLYLFLDAFGQLSKSTLAEGTESEESEDEDGSMAYRTAGKNDRTDEELSLTGSAIGGIVLET